ncbi:MAG: flagellar basal body-associated FliL family protein [bacterium]
MAENNKERKEEKKAPSIIVIALVVVVVAALTSYGTMTFLSREQENASPTKQAEKIGPTYSLGDFVVNLSDMQFLQTTIVIEVDSEKIIEDLDERKAQIRDSIIAILRSQSTKIMKESDATTVKNAIRNELNKILGPETIHKVWFTELVFQ